MPLSSTGATTGDPDKSLYLTEGALGLLNRNNRQKYDSSHTSQPSTMARPSGTCGHCPQASLQTRQWCHPDGFQDPDYIPDGIKYTCCDDSHFAYSNKGGGSFAPIDANEKHPWLSAVEPSYRAYSDAHTAWRKSGYEKGGVREKSFSVAEKTLQTKLKSVKDVIDPRDACDVLITYRTGQENDMNDTALQHVWLGMTPPKKKRQ